MIFKGLILTLLLVSINTVQIDVLVESLCPDCMNFISQSFSPFYKAKDHQNLATVTFYPYGNAHQTWDGKKWNFQCQHGSNECYGNLIETCVVKQLSADFSHSFLICLEGSISYYRNDFKSATNYCLNNQPQTVKDTVWNCVNSDLGNKLQHEVANFSESVQPAHQYVPWVIVDGKHDPQVEDAIINDMLGYLCQVTKSDIAACNGRSKFLNILLEKKSNSKCYRN